MKFKFYTIIFLTLSLISCKKEVDNQSNLDSVEDISKKTDENLVKVTFNLLIKKDDNLHLYYTDDESINFDEQKSLWMPIKGNEQSQEVTFIFPEDVLPTHLRVDFGYGKNEEQSVIELNKFKVNYYNKSFEANGVEIFNYFYPNELNTTIIKNTSSLQRLNKSQETAPSLYPHIALTEQLEKLIK